MRVFYDVDLELAVVWIRAIGRKVRNRILIGATTRKAAALELGRLQCARAIPKLLGLLESEPPMPNESLPVHVLHVLGPDAAAAVPALMSALGPLDTTVPFNDSWALGKIGEGAMEALPTLEALTLRYGSWPLLDEVIDEIAPRSKRSPP